MNTFKSIKKAASLLLIPLIISLFLPIYIYAWEAHLNENNDVEIYTIDKKKTSDIWYYTEGVSITRCQSNPASKNIHSSGEYFNAYLGNASIAVRNGTEYNTWIIPIGTIISYASSIDASWGNEIRAAVDGTGPAVYIKLDCIMYTVDDTMGGLLSGPFINAPGVFGGNGNLETGIDAAGTPIKYKYGWANPNGLRTHFNHYLLIGSGAVVEEVDVSLDDELVAYDYTMDHYAGIDENVPAYATGNYSNKFDLSKGIPSSEDINNRFFADSFVANTSVYGRYVGKSYSFRMTYMWEENHPYLGFYDSDNDGIKDRYGWIDDIDTYSESHRINVGTAYMGFEYLANFDIYDFTNADIGNGAYEGDHIYYDDPSEVSFECISTNAYTDVRGYSSTPNWYASNEAHLSFPSSISYPTSKWIDKKEDIPDEILKDTENIKTWINSKCRSRNDRLMIEGHTFMNNSWVYGCNFFKTEPSTFMACTKSSGYIYDYCLRNNARPLHSYDPNDVTGFYTVQIPPTVDNGQYYTSMKVYYDRLATGERATKRFEAGE